MCSLRISRFLSRGGKLSERMKWTTYKCPMTSYSTTAAECVVCRSVEVCTSEAQVIQGGSSLRNRAEKGLGRGILSQV